ncbi:hypothetical protein [Methylobacterium sp. J-067]|uniref:hypothetical protein n=1 Tax=Methylobacterium sp. J-067 TaxID=2836648 RepID=UPI001FB98BE1|nr:hypothetical protein [Methylobacterium sp. J-067]MCJ2023103.1 hypothetical protein [Methylobacterium sp. J-067]
MPDEPIPPAPVRTEDLAVTEYDAGHRVRGDERGVPAAESALPTNDEAPEVGLSQKGDGEDAVVKRETEI